VIRPYYKSDYMAQKAINGNIPPHSGLTADSPASAFANGWVSHFEGGGKGALSSSGGPLAFAGQPNPSGLPPEITNGNSYTSTGGRPMPDPSQGALSQQPQGGGGILGTGGIGNTLQQLGAWLQVPNNPGGGASLLQQAQAPLQREQQMRMQMLLANKPQLVDAGTDPLTGQKRFVKFDPLTGQVSAPTMSGGASGGTSSSSTGGAGGGDLSTTDFDRYSATRAKFAQGQASADDLRKAAPPLLQGYTDALMKGTAIPSNLGNRAGQLRPYAIELAHTLDPNFDESQIPARVQFTKDLATTNNPGKVGGALASSAKVVDHASQLSENLAKLQQLQYFSGSAGDVNKLQAWMKARGTDDQYNTLMNQIGIDSDFVASEVSKLANGGKPALAELEHMRSMLDPSKRSTTAVQGGLRSIMGIMHGSVDPLVQNYNTAFGKTGADAKSVEDFWSQDTKNKFGKVLATQPVAAAPAASAGPGAPVAPPAPTNRPPLSSFQR
jgi:hypothetical protein